MPRIATMPLPSPCNPWQGVQKILKRPSPRSSSSWLTGSGNAFESFGIVSASSASTPRCTVFSRIGRSERPSVKKSDGDSGRFFGCSAMSCFRLHPPSSAEKATAHNAMRAGLIILHLADVCCVHALEEALRVFDVEFFVARLNAQKELVGRGVLHKALNVEQRMIGLGQLIQGKHPENRRKRSAEHGELKRDRDECRPAIEWAPRDVHRVRVKIDPVLKEESAEAAAQSADQRNQRNKIAFQSERIVQRLYWKWRVTFD